MDDDNVNEEDVRLAVIKGRLLERQTRHPRGTRFLLSGPTADGSPLNVVCRLINDVVRIVTVFRP
jgi:hypothetical protein